VFIPTSSEHQHILESKTDSASGLLVYITIAIAIAIAIANAVAIAININININISINNFFFIPSPHEWLLLFPTLVKSDMKSFYYHYVMSRTDPVVLKCLLQPMLINF